MASPRSNIVVVMVAAAAMLFTLSGADLCPSSDLKLVYPYWSDCWNPALYNSQEAYEFAAAPGYDVSGSVAPEYDESNSTYYMRLAEVGAKYRLTSFKRIANAPVTQSEGLSLLNVDTRRYLGWRQEGEDEYFLVEVEDIFSAAVFQFPAAANVPLACPRSLSARCEAYYVVTSSTSLGWSPYEEGAAIYIKRGTDSGIPFLLLRELPNERPTQVSK